MPQDRITHLEETIAHLTQTVEELSDVAARQDKDLAQLVRRVEMLMQREAAREAEAGGSAVLSDQRPPHW